MASERDAKVESLIREFDEYVEEYGKSYVRLTWREKVLLLVQAGAKFKALGKHTDPRAAKVCARDRIRLYLAHHVGSVIRREEIEVVSGISDYARRVRELRVQDGYKILTGLTNDPEMELVLSSSEYYLVDAEPDHKAARRWSMANRIRRASGTGSRERLLAYFKENVGEVVTTEELAYVSRDKRQYARRTRELRTEQGYAIATRFTGRPDLRMGEYVMESAERIAEPHDRLIPYDVQKRVFRRDDNTCRLCGWNRAKWRRDDPRILELHHIEAHAARGENAAGNLILLCSRCHDELHAGRLEIPEDMLR